MKDRIEPVARRAAVSGRVLGRDFLYAMLLSRECDRREGILMRQGEGWITEPGMGHEPTMAVPQHLRAGDYLFLYCRDRPLYLARGISVRQMAREFLALATSTTQGRLMPLHCSSRELNLFPGVTAMGAECLPAVGVAWGLKLAGGEDLVLCTIGDASTRQGEFYEAVCLAVQERLPILFLVEDNGFGVSTPTADMLPFRLGVFGESLFTRVDGRDVEVLHEVAGREVAAIRAGQGPRILWCELDRLGSHTNADDHRLYRTEEEIAAMQCRDPVASFARRLIEDGELSADDWAGMQTRAADEVDEAFREVSAEAPPDPAQVLDHVYGPQVRHEPLALDPPDAPITMVEAINQTLHAALARFPEIVCFGEDIEDPKGGVFGLTRGLSTEHPDRVTNSPLAEATIVGTAAGLAACGYRPVFEVQFIDYITPGFHQLVTQIATLRWRSAGAWSCPLVLYAPYGAYLPGGGPWHSQSNDAWWAHIPGLRVAVPSTPGDAAGLFWTAMQDSDPSLILLPKHLMRMRSEVTAFEPVPFGEASIRRSGEDVTVVAWGNALEVAEGAADQLLEQGVSLEILDLRTLVPCDWSAVERSLARTGRLVVVHEDSHTAGFGAAVITEMVRVQRRFELLFSPPQLVARDDVPIPYHPDLEYAVLPSVERVIEAVHRTLE